MLDQPLSERLRAVRDAQAAPAGESPSPSAPEPGRRTPLGQLLVEKGTLSEADLGLALEQQRRDGRPLGQILLEMGVVTPGDLARTLTEQHGFDFNASLRRRLASAPVEPQASAAGDSPLDERYLVREASDAAPLHVAGSFLDAADAAFELIEDRDPERLEIVRAADAGLELLWSYRRDDGPEPAGSASDAAA